MYMSILLLFHPVFIQTPRLHVLDRRPPRRGAVCTCGHLQIIPNFPCSPTLARFVLGLKANRANPPWGSEPAWGLIPAGGLKPRYYEGNGGGTYWI